MKDLKYMDLYILGMLSCFFFVANDVTTAICMLVWTGLFAGLNWIDKRRVNK